MQPFGSFYHNNPGLIIHFYVLYSAIHKAAVHRSAGGWNDPQRPFPIDGFMAFSGIVPGKAGNSSAGGFVNSAVNEFMYQLMTNISDWPV